MARIAVAGLINVETTVRVEGFPIGYRPQNFPFFGLRTTVSGVGYNVATALIALGHEVVLLSLTGYDLHGERCARRRSLLPGRSAATVAPTVS